MVKFFLMAVLLIGDLVMIWSFAEIRYNTGALYALSEISKDEALKDKLKRDRIHRWLSFSFIVATHIAFLFLYGR